MKHKSRGPLRRAIGLGSVSTLVALGALSTPASAASISCGTVISKSITLKADVGPCQGTGVIVGADNITLDLGGHSIFGAPGPGDGSAAGIRLPMRTGVTVRHGTVRAFDGGVVIDAGSRNVVTGLTVRGNVGPNVNPQPELGDGIVAFHSSGNRIIGNTVSGNGRYDGIGIWGSESNENVIQSNVVQDTVGVRSDLTFNGTGIVVSHVLDTNDAGSGESIFDNKVVSNVIRRNAGSGVSNISSVNGVVVGNLIRDNGLRYFGQFGSLPANGIGVQRGPQATPVTHMLIEENAVIHNGVHGLILINGDDNHVSNNVVTENGGVGIADAGGRYPAEQNQILHNTTGNNGIFDLLDTNTTPCDHNTWFGNTWGPPSVFALDAGFTTSYYPDCTAAGGSGPNPPQQPIQSVSATMTSSSTPPGSTILGQGVTVGPSRHHSG